MVTFHGGVWMAEFEKRVQKYSPSVSLSLFLFLLRSSLVNVYSYTRYLMSMFNNPFLDLLTGEQGSIFSNHQFETVGVETYTDTARARPWTDPFYTLSPYPGGADDLSPWKPDLHARIY